MTINITYQENKSSFLDQNVWNTFVAGGALSDGVSPFSLLQEMREQPGKKERRNKTYFYI